MKRVLMISHAFPPTGGSGVQRPAKFAKYLAAYGWTPFVWSADRVPELPEDRSLLDDLPPSVIHRTLRAYPIRATVRRALAAARAHVEPLGSVDRWISGIEWRTDLLLARLARWPVPDTAVAWMLRGVAPLRRLIVRERIDVIWSTFPAPSNHLLAWRLHALTRRPWVADFRDLWTQNFNYAQPSRWRRAVDGWLERALVRAATHVVGVSEGQTALWQMLDETRPHKFSTITNGADLDDRFDEPMESAREALDIPARRFVVSYVGRLVSTASAHGMLRGIERLIQRRDRARADLELRFVGWVSPEFAAQLRRMNVRAVLRGLVPHPAAIRELCAADLLLSGSITHAQNGETVIPGKMFEYFASGRPVLHVGVPGGEVDRLLVRYDAGVTVPNDADAVADQLERDWMAWTDDRLRSGCDRRHVGAFRRRELARRLAALFDELIEPRRGFNSTQLTALAPAKVRGAVMTMPPYDVPSRPAAPVVAAN